MLFFAVPPCLQVQKPTSLNFNAVNEISYFYFRNSTHRLLQSDHIRFFQLWNLSLECEGNFYSSWSSFFISHYIHWYSTIIRLLIQELVKNFITFYTKNIYFLLWKRIDTPFPVRIDYSIGGENMGRYQRGGGFRAYLQSLRSIISVLFFYQLYLIIFSFSQFDFVMLMILGGLLGLLWWIC